MTGNGEPSETECGPCAKQIDEDSYGLHGHDLGDEPHVVELHVENADLKRVNETMRSAIASFISHARASGEHNSIFSCGAAEGIVRIGDTLNQYKPPHVSARAEGAGGSAP